MSEGSCFDFATGVTFSQAIPVQAYSHTNCSSVSPNRKYMAYFMMYLQSGKLDEIGKCLLLPFFLLTKFLIK